MRSGVESIRAATTPVRKSGPQATYRGRMVLGQGLYRLRRGDPGGKQGFRDLVRGGLEEGIVTTSPYGPAVSEGAQSRRRGQGEVRRGEFCDL